MKRKRLQKLIDLAAATLFITSLIYISGQYGSLECDVISTRQFIIRAGVGLVLLGTGSVLSNVRLEN